MKNANIIAKSKFTLSRKRSRRKRVKPKTAHLLFALAIVLFSSCATDKELQAVTVRNFEEFVQSTSYVTEAEKYGWSIVQKTISHYTIVNQATWKKPDGIHPAKDNYPVTQISYNDAIAYCTWANVQLPSYELYWKKTASDKRPITSNTITIQPANETNIIGNTWDITSTTNNKQEMRLAGGSYLCNQTTCNGTSKERVLYVSKDTGNSHISFSVLNK